MMDWLLRRFRHDADPLPVPERSDTIPLCTIQLKLRTEELRKLNAAAERREDMRSAHG